MIGETREKKPMTANSIIIKNGGNEQIACYVPEFCQCFSCYDLGMTLRLRRIFFSQMSKIDEQRFLNIDPCPRSNSENSGEVSKNLGKMFCNMCERGFIFTYLPAACRFMKILTHLQRLKGFSLLSRRAYLKEQP